MPDRFVGDDGYDLDEKHVEAIGREGAGLIIAAEWRVTRPVSSAGVVIGFCLA
jgi:hypothetical protein